MLKLHANPLISKDLEELYQLAEQEKTHKSDNKIAQKIILLKFHIRSTLMFFNTYDCATKLNYFIRKILNIQLNIILFIQIVHSCNNSL